MSNNIAITVNGEGLDLPSDLSINFTLKNKLFYRTIIPGINSYDINIPVTERNKRILGFRNVIESESPTARVIGATLFLEGVKYTSGVIKIRGASNNKFRTSFQAFNDKLRPLQGLKLSDIDMGGQYYADDKYKDIWHVTYVIEPGETAAVEIDNTVFSQSFTDTPYHTIVALRDQINASGLATKLVAGEFTSGLSIQQGDWATVLTLAARGVNDSFSVKEPSQNTAQTSVFPPVDPVTGDYNDWLKDRYRIFHKLGQLADSVYPDVKVCWPTILNPDFYGSNASFPDSANFPPRHQRLVNDYGINDQHKSPGYVNPYKLQGHRYDTGQPYLSPGDSNNRFYVKPMVPCFFVLHVLDRIFNYIGLSVKGGFTRDDEIKKLAIYGNMAADTFQATGVGTTFEKYKQANGWDINLNDFAPDTDIITFLKDVLLRYFNCTLQVNEAQGEVVIDYANDLISNTELLPVKRTHLYNIRYDQVDGFEFSTKQPGDQFYSDNHEDKRVLLGKQIKNPVTTNAGLPSSNNSIGDVRLVQNQNLYYIYRQSGWAPYSYNYYDYQPINVPELEEITPDNSFLPVIYEPKGFYRPPFIQIYYSQSGQSKHQITINGKSYSFSDSDATTALQAIADRINKNEDELAALVFEKLDTTNNVRLSGILVYIPKNSDSDLKAFNWDIDFGVNESDKIAPFQPSGIFSTNPTTPKGNIDANVKFLMPAIKQKGVSAKLTGNNGKDATRFFFYRGLQPSVHGGEEEYAYPLATPDIYNAVGDAIGSYAIRWRGDKGLYNKFWKSYNQKINQGKNVESELVMNIDELMSMDVHTQLESEENLYWWRELQFQVNMASGIQPVKGKLLKQH